MNTSGRVGEGDAQVRLRLTTMVVEGPAAKTKRARRGMMMATVGGGPRTRRGRRGRVQAGAEEEEARSRVEEAARWPENRSMIAGPLTVIQTSETKPAKTAAAAAGPRWTLASVAVGPEEDEAGQVGLWLKMKGWLV